MKYFLLIGLPSSGKSTIGEKLKNEYNAVIISLDGIRKEWYGDENILGGNEVVKEMKNRAIKALDNGQNVILDATHLVLSSRRRALEWVNSYEDLEKIAVIIDTPLNVCLERNSLRERVVPKGVIYKMNKSIVEPSLEEGFTNIITYNQDGNLVD